MDEQQNNTSITTPETVPAAKPITLQSILECKEGTTIAIKKFFTGKSNNEQLQRMNDYQSFCLKNFSIIQQKIKEEVNSDSNLKLATALEKTQNRIALEQKMIKFLIKSEGPEASIQVGEEMLGFVFAAKLVTPQENQAWDEYKISLESEKLPPPPKGNTDFLGWGLLIIMLFIVGRALIKKQGAKGTAENETKEKPPL